MCEIVERGEKGEREGWRQEEEKEVTVIYFWRTARNQAGNTCDLCKDHPVVPGSFATPFPIAV